MQANRFGSLVFKAPGFLGALFCSALLVLIPSCKKDGQAPDWDTPGESLPTAEVGGGSGTSASAEVEQKPVVNSVEDTAAELPEEEIGVGRDLKPAGEPLEGASTTGLRFMAYNVENWLTMDRYVDNKQLKDAAKPEAEKKAAIQLIARHVPDVLGVCEIGTREDLLEIQAALKAAGLDLPNLHYSGGSDPVRHLGLLSRYPITGTATVKENTFRIDGTEYSFNRGVLDATVEARGKSYRFLGVHLKSKREVEDGDQELMRQGEARLLRKHVDSIFEADAEARLVVYGDFNDTRPSPSFRTVTGSYNDPKYLTAIPAKDSRGHAWTHHWNPHDIYSRIDFVTVSRVLRAEVDFDKSYLVDDEEWSVASDHRPLVAIFK